VLQTAERNTRRPDFSQMARGCYLEAMCRSIKTLFNFAPPASDEEIRAAALQFVRKLAGTRSPSKTNQHVFDEAVQEIFLASRKLIDDLIATGPPKDRAVEAAKAKERSRRRFGA
jgi:hypothetical protein